MGTRLITEVSAEPVSLVEAKGQCKVEVDDDDGLIAGLVLTARLAAEDFTRRKLATQTWEYLIDYNWPREKVNGCLRPRIVLPFPPLQSVTSVKYYDTAGVEQTLAADQYRVDPTSIEGRIDPAYAVTWPTVRDQMATITVRFVCGYSAPPEPIRQAILIAVADLYSHRESVVVGTIATELPASAKALLFPYRCFY